MNYQTFQPHPDLSALVKCYWSLEVPAEMQAPKQRIVPDGCIEMFFILGDDVRRYTSEDEFVIQPRAMVLGQITEPFYIQPVGHVNTFAIRFYPYGFANFVDTEIRNLADKDTPLAQLFGQEPAEDLTQEIRQATTSQQRIGIIEDFLLQKLIDSSTIDRLVKSTIDSLLMSKGSVSIKDIARDNDVSRRSLERKFVKQVGISPKQLSKVIRLQAALKSMLNRQTESLTEVAYENEYYDQAHFIKDFKELTGTSPKDYLDDDQMLLSSLIYSQD